MYIYIHIHTYVIHTYACAYVRLRSDCRRGLAREGAGPHLGTHYRGVQWEGGALDGGSIIQ